MCMPGTGSGAFGVRTSGNSTMSHPPVGRRSDFPTTIPSTDTAPCSASSAALVRLIPSNRARPASTRSPAMPSGTGRERTSLIAILRSGLGVRVVRPVVAAFEGDPYEREDRDPDRRSNDEDVGDVAHEETVVVQEVHDVADPEPGIPEQPVGEVAQRSPQKHREHDRPPPRTEAEGEPDDDGRDDDGGAGEHPRRA